MNATPDKRAIYIVPSPHKNGRFAVIEAVKVQSARGQHYVDPKMLVDRLASQEAQATAKRYQALMVEI